MGDRMITVTLPAEVEPEVYAALVHAFYTAIDLTGLGDRALLGIDEHATDDQLNTAFDRHNAHYTWGL